MLAAVLSKRGLATDVLPHSAISAGEIAGLADRRPKLVCVSYLGFGSGPAQIRYLVRRLRRALPEGTAILVAYWERDETSGDVDGLLELVRADAYATSLHEAVEICVGRATGESPVRRLGVKACRLGPKQSPPKTSVSETSAPKTSVSRKPKPAPA